MEDSFGFIVCGGELFAAHETYTNMWVCQQKKV